MTDKHTNQRQFNTHTRTHKEGKGGGGGREGKGDDDNERFTRAGEQDYTEEKTRYTTSETETTVWLECNE